MKTRLITTYYIKLTITLIAGILIGTLVIDASSVIYTVKSLVRNMTLYNIKFGFSFLMGHMKYCLNMPLAG
jgi:hypothetical protein